MHNQSGKPKGCVSSLQSLQHYIRAKNLAHGIECGKSKVLLASAITFDPCFSDILATFVANVTISLASRARLYGREDDVLVSPDNSITTYHGLTSLLRQLQITHVLCTPTLWATVEGDPPNNIPSLQVVALGGEPIPKTMRARWARRQTQDETNSNDVWDREYPRLYATYGVTEACVYQTCGEVVQIDEQNRVSQGLSVGISLLGTKIHVCQPLSDDDSNKSSSLEQLLQSAGEEPVVGEVVLSGAQVDAMSSYLNLPSLTKSVFIQSKTVPSSASDDAFLYRTGDLGYIHPQTNNLHILGRIKGDGMVKINGVRIELAEIESSLIDNVVDDEGGGLVTDCMASTTTARPVDESEGSNSMQKKQLIAYCILSSRCISELRIAKEQLKNGLIVPPGSLLAVLRERCDLRVRKGCTPSFFVIIDRLPLSPTGKRDRSRLPPLDTCFLMDCGNGDQGQSLWNIGTAGAIVAEKICECLNLQSYQRALVTRGSNFFLLGGDSLAA
jgi:acyl-CoA synthetase (AMP-forming)/AMP-acid ligase II